MASIVRISLAPPGKRLRDARLCRRRALAVASAGTILVAGACKRAGPSAQQSDTASSSGQPKAGGTLNLWVQHDPSDWNPSSGPASPQMEGRELAYNGLLRFQAGSSVPFNTLALQPELAESWESPDDQTYTFHLRKGLRFANLPPAGGRELTSADVQWSYQYEANSGQFLGKKAPPSVYAWMFAGMSDIQTPDASTVVMRFTRPFAPWLNYAATGGTMIVPHEIFDHDGDFNKRVVGAGMWQLDAGSVQPGTSYTWTRNASYWQQGRPYIDQLRWLILRDDATAFAAFESNQVDLLNGGPGAITKQAAEQVKRKVADAVTYDKSGGGLIMTFNVSAPPLNDARLRQAISLALDWQGILQGAEKITGSPGTLGLAGAMPDTFTQDEIKKLLKYDPAQAKQLLAAAGHPDGFDAEVIYNSEAYGEAFTSMLQLVQAQLKQSGINLLLKGLDGATKNRRSIQHDFTVLVEADNPEVDIDNTLYRRFYPIPGGNAGLLDDSKLNQLVGAQRQEKDATKRRDIVRQAIQLIHEQAYARVVYVPAEEVIWRPRLQGFAPNTGFGGWPLKDSWLAT